MQIQLRFFASVREALGVAQETVTVPSDVTTVGDLRRWLRVRGSAWDETLADGRALRTAQNQQMCGPDTLLEHNAEIAFFPPVTGG